MGGLTNGYVQWIMRRASFKPRAFKGVLPCDLFLEYIKANKNNIKPGDCFILNLSSSNSKGTHFVCFFVLDSRTGEYFDSYGLPSFDSNLNRAFKLTKLDISPFKMRLQSDTSQFCGLFCIAYLLCRQVGLPIKTFEQQFNGELHLNDSVALELVKMFIEEKT